MLSVLFQYNKHLLKANLCSVLCQLLRIMSLNLSYKLENHDKIEILKSLKIKYIVWKKIKLYPYLIAYSEINSGLNRIKLAK